MSDFPCIGAIYPNDAWVDADVQRLIDEFRCLQPNACPRDVQISVCVRVE